MAETIQSNLDLLTVFIPEELAYQLGLSDAGIGVGEQAVDASHQLIATGYDPLGEYTAAFSLNDVEFTSDPVHVAEIAEQLRELDSKQIDPFFTVDFDDHNDRLPESDIFYVALEESHSGSDEEDLGEYLLGSGHEAAPGETLTEVAQSWLANAGSELFRGSSGTLWACSSK